MQRRNNNSYITAGESCVISDSKIKSDTGRRQTSKGLLTKDFRIDFPRKRTKDLRGGILFEGMYHEYWL